MVLQKQIMTLLQYLNQISRSERFLLCRKCKGSKKLLVISGSMLGADKIITQDEYENALEGDMNLDKK